MQKITAEVEIKIPKDYVLITKAEFESFKENELSGIYWTMRDLENRTGRKQRWLKQFLLYKPEFKKTLDSKNGGFVFYPMSQGQSWSFHAKRMAEFLDKNFHKIFN